MLLSPAMASCKQSIANRLGIPLIFDRFYLATDEVHGKLPGLACASHIINASSCAQNRFKNLFVYLNVTDPIQNDRSVLDIVNTWLARPEKNTQILIHSDDPKKTREVFLTICINRGIGLLDLVTSMKKIYSASVNGSINSPHIVSSLYKLKFCEIQHLRSIEKKLRDCDTVCNRFGSMSIDDHANENDTSHAKYIDPFTTTHDEHLFEHDEESSDIWPNIDDMSGQLFGHNEESSEDIPNIDEKSDKSSNHDEQTSDNLQDIEEKSEQLLNHDEQASDNRSDIDEKSEQLPKRDDHPWANNDMTYHMPEYHEHSSDYVRPPIPEKCEVLIDTPYYHTDPYTPYYHEDSYIPQYNYDRMSEDPMLSQLIDILGESVDRQLINNMLTDGITPAEIIELMCKN